MKRGYVSTEFVFYLMSPIFLLAFAQSQYFGYILAVLSITLSNVTRAYAMLAYNMPPTQLGWSRPLIFNANFMEVCSNLS
ncbi:unnamed protein product [Gongylonema pulchrum]|uniref:MFS transporter n=1 Tax=Gongylonema pulchrum TaxID=637853 RepID=A0A183D5G0_9BILA|nr:unnamed protein product [Gongylonema pulchrum]